MSYETSIYKTGNSQSELAVESLVNRIIRFGKMSRKDHLLLTSIVLADGEVSESERRQINRIFDYIQSGRLELVDWY
jgi:uncharacterized tellurite resistance protein B-like protein